MGKVAKRCFVFWGEAGRFDRGRVRV